MLDKGDDLRLLLLEDFLPSNDIDREVPRRLGEPGGGVFRNAVIGPGLERTNERFLNDIFRKLQPIDAEDAGQDRYKLSRLVPEKMVRQLADLRRGRRRVVGGHFAHRFAPCHPGMGLMGVMRRVGPMNKVKQALSRGTYRFGKSFQTQLSERGRELLCNGVCFDRPLLHRAEVRDRSHFDHGTIFQAGTFLRDPDRFIHIVDLQIKVAADRFLRFREGAIGNGAPLFSGNDFPFVLQRMAGFHFALLSEAFKPCGPVRDNLLQLLG